MAGALCISSALAGAARQARQALMRYKPSCRGIAILLVATNRTTAQ